VQQAHGAVDDLLADSLDLLPELRELVAEGGSLYIFERLPVLALLHNCDDGGLVSRHEVLVSFLDLGVFLPELPWVLVHLGDGLFLSPCR